ncbi:MAG: Heat shock protein [Roseibaca calidilacus]|uniref:Heat shock protein n=1 Tax=Roseibaca calidilacus TaxID=1666912 RepID=A0A0N8K6U5_9RHOB|nr:META domain-containing protein [Roseibaca calidilacus]KPP89913.1 MAG: Heat shock protein [Roseibaca calidilacus]CUX80989.1 Heat shock protein HslJ [Roseibaca calidilacus]
MRVIAISCAITALAQGVQARDVALTLDWPTDTAPATEIVAVTRDTAGAVLDTQRLTLPADTRNAVLPLPSLSRQASTVQVGALVDDAFALQSARAPVEGGQAPEQMQLNAALSASFSDAYLCNSGQVIALFPDGDAVRLEGQRFSPAALEGRFTAPDGTVLNRAPGLLQLETAEGTLIDSCQAIPARPILPLTALGPDASWKVHTEVAGSMVLTTPEPPADPVPELAPTKITRTADDVYAFRIGRQTLRVEHRPCQLPGLDMPYPFTAQLSAPGASFPPGCAGNPLHALEGPVWQVTHLYGLPLPRADERMTDFSVQVNAGRLSGRTNCNRYLGRAAIAETRLQVTDLGTTRLSCPANQSNLEIRFLDALEAATGIKHLPDGSLALYAGPVAVLVATR